MDKTLFVVTLMLPSSGRMGVLCNVSVSFLFCFTSETDTVLYISFDTKYTQVLSLFSEVVEYYNDHFSSFNAAQ